MPVSSAWSRAPASAGARGEIRHNLRRLPSPHPLALLLAFAAALRLAAALTPGFHHPDAIYQYLEPAHRLLTGEGLVTWEWRVGMRSWLLPTLLAVPMALGRWLDPGGDLPLALPRIAVALASLAIVWAAWQIADRHSRRAAWLVGFVAACWFEFVHFGAQTLAEPVAVAAFLPAAALSTTPHPRYRALVGSGALLALAVLLRPHYAPAALAVVLVARHRDLARTLPAMLIGAVAIAAIGAAADLWNHATPFHWMVENVRQNVIEHRADAYGIAPPFALVAWYITMWGWFAIPLLIGVRFGWRRCVPLVVAAAVNLALHSLIGHKEYRFVFLTTAALVVIAAIGWAELLRLAAARWPGRRADVANAAVFAMWGVASVALSYSPVMAQARADGRAGSLLFADLRDDRTACGVAVVEGATFADIPGATSLRDDQSLSLFAAHDPVYAGGDASVALRRWAAGYDRILTSDRAAHLLPQSYRRARCEAWEGTRLCLYARRGQCVAQPQSPFAANTALIRLRF